MQDGIAVENLVVVLLENPPGKDGNGAVAGNPPGVERIRLPCVTDDGVELSLVDDFHGGRGEV